MPSYSRKTKNRAKHALDKMEIDFVSFCGRGQHPDAKVAIFKSADARTSEAMQLAKSIRNHRRGGPSTGRTQRTR